MIPIGIIRRKKNRKSVNPAGGGVDFGNGKSAFCGLSKCNEEIPRHFDAVVANAPK